MNASKLTTRVLTIALAMAASACHQRGALAADPAEPVAPVAPHPADAPDTADGFNAAGAWRKMVRSSTVRSGPVPGGEHPPGAFGSGGGGKSALGLQFARESLFRIPAADAPAVLVTEPIDAKVQAEWKEDLNVMDKLLRDAVGGPEQPWIKVTMMGVGGRVAPMYVEGAGVVLSTAAGFPLAPAGKDADGGADRPRERASASVKAKRELKGYGPAADPGRAEAPPMEFEQDKLDAFVATVLKVLPEASNFRHLKENESVFVTVSGFDESGLPVRMTLKAKKADVNQAAGGKLDADAFKQRVARRIG